MCKVLQLRIEFKVSVHLFIITETFVEYKLSNATITGINTKLRQDLDYS